MKRKEKAKLKKEAAGKVKEYFEKAKANPLMGTRFIRLARKIAMKVNYRMPSGYRRKFCRHCYTYFSGENYRVRTRNKFLVYYCHSCKKHTRIGLRAKKVKA